MQIHAAQKPFDRFPHVVVFLEPSVAQEVTISQGFRRAFTALVHQRNSCGRRSVDEFGTEFNGPRTIIRLQCIGASADAIACLEDEDVNAALREERRSGQPRSSCADNRDAGFQLYGRHSRNVERAW